MNDRFSERRIKVKFCVKSEKNASDTCAIFCEVYEERLRKIQVFLNGINCSKKPHILKLQMKTLFITSFEI
jgi:hypothetical protein